MSATTNTQILFVKRPTGMPVPSETFRVVQSPIPRLKDGQVLVRVLYLSLDPAMRGMLHIGDVG
jgi:NADPH-dependent curcumin reductase CurA